MKSCGRHPGGAIHCARSGFALVITLSLMILLTVIAVGLLTLSSISLRASTQGNAMATARSNARMALMLAIGELQKSAGTDQCVTARADVVTGTSANAHLTGVWDSWEIKATSPPTASDYQQSTRDAKFKSWLVSGSDPVATRQLAFAKQAPTDPVTLWGRGSLGVKTSADQFVSASKVKLSSSPGAFAWAVLDEGIKARINTRYSDDAASTGAKTMELGSGERPGVEFIAGLNGLERKYFKQGSTQSTTIDKGVTRLNFALVGENFSKGVREALMPLTHDVTT